MVPTLGGSTQDTDLNKGFTKGIFRKIFGEEMGGSGGPRPPYVLHSDWLQKTQETILIDSITVSSCLFVAAHF